VFRIEDLFDLSHAGVHSDGMVEAQIIRPRREHAIEFALRTFAAGERVDMQTLAAQLGVGRTTLYRWVGDREQLIGEALGILTNQVWDAIIAEQERNGIEGALERIRRFMEVTSSFAPLRRFAETEPGPALRVLMTADGPVAQALREGSTRAYEASMGVPADPEVTEVLVQLGTALEWAPIVAGEEPAIDRAIDLMRTVLSGHAAG